MKGDIYTIRKRHGRGSWTVPARAWVAGLLSQQLWAQYSVTWWWHWAPQIQCLLCCCTLCTASAQSDLPGQFASAQQAVVFQVCHCGSREWCRHGRMRLSRRMALEHCQKPDASLHMCPTRGFAVRVCRVTCIGFTRILLASTSKSIENHWQISHEAVLLTMQHRVRRGQRMAGVAPTAGALKPICCSCTRRWRSSSLGQKMTKREGDKEADPSPRHIPDSYPRAEQFAKKKRTVLKVMSLKAVFSSSTGLEHTASSAVQKHESRLWPCLDLWQCLWHWRRHYWHRLIGHVQAMR